jgi:hypothetical protein
MLKALVNHVSNVEKYQITLNKDVHVPGEVVEVCFIPCDMFEFRCKSLTLTPDVW